MATLIGSKAKSGVQARFLETGTITVVADYTTSATLSSGDTLQMIKIPKGARVTALKVGVNEDVFLAVGDGINTARYVATATAANTIIGLETTLGMTYEYTASDTIDIHYRGGQTATTSMVFSVIASYICDDSSVF